jgi:hypothetical protein
MSERDGSIDVDEHMDTCATCGETGDICDCDGYWTAYDSRVAMPKITKADYVRILAVSVALTAFVFWLVNSAFMAAGGQ